MWGPGPDLNLTALPALRSAVRPLRFSPRDPTPRSGQPDRWPRVRFTSSETNGKGQEQHNIEQTTTLPGREWNIIAHDDNRATYPQRIHTVP